MFKETKSDGLLFSNIFYKIVLHLFSLIFIVETMPFQADTNKMQYARSTISAVKASATR